VKMRFKALLLVLLALVLILAGCGSGGSGGGNDNSSAQSGGQQASGGASGGSGGGEQKSEPKFYRFGGGIGGSSWELTAGKVSEMLSKYVPNMTVTAQPGSMGENLSRLARKEVELGLTYAFPLRDALDGTGDYEDLPNPDLRFMLNLFPSYEQILVPKDAPWETIEDLAKDPSQLKIAALTPGSGTYILIDGVLKAVGTSLDDVAAKGGLVQPFDYAQGLEGLKNGTINVLPVIGPPNHPSIMEFEQEGKFLTYSEETLKKIQETIPGAVPAMFPGTYAFLDGPNTYKTFAIYTIIVTHAGVPEEDVYNMTKAFWENVDDFRSVASYTEETYLETALSGANIPVHPGALKYYEEMGLDTSHVPAN